MPNAGKQSDKIAIDTLGFRTAKTFDGKPFVQPGAPPARGLLDFLRWRFTAKPTRWPRSVALAPQPAPPEPHGNEIVATWLGHATFLLQTTRGNVLFDPVFSNRVSPLRRFGPRRVHAVPIPLQELPCIDAVCVSHDHYDHCDVNTLRQLAARSRDTVFIGPLRHRDLFSATGAKHIVELDWWESYPLSRGIEISLTPTKHWTNRLGHPRNYRLWGGFWIRWPRGDRGLPKGRTGSPGHEDSRDVWYVSDTGYDPHLWRDIRSRYGVPDLALMPIGAYEPRWFMAPMHMNPAEAVRTHREIGARQSLAMHWGTFQLTDEGREEPVRALAEALADQDVPSEQFRVIAPGESVVV